MPAGWNPSARNGNLSDMDAFGLVVTIVVLLAIATAILLFERRRAERIEHDTRQDARDRSSGQVDGEDDEPQ